MDSAVLPKQTKEQEMNTEKMNTAKMIALLSEVKEKADEAPASAPTLAAKIVALSSAHNDADFVPAAAAVEAGLEFPEDIIQFDRVAPFTIAMNSLENSNLGRVPNLVDFRGSHYRLRDGSWILFRADWGRYPIVSSGKPEEDPIGGHD